MGIVEAPMKANTTCSEPGCENLCVTKDRKRVIEKENGQIQKARCCGVCGKWYCHQHKKAKMRKFINYSKLTAESNYDYEVTYKCDPRCLGIERKNQS
eukprot:CAMPEP_0197032820 /NCGR_PEP_ID=MMETSP1384-20130603/11391_1 /TAXON_ID=29189 /ORGANISM="Ammonia sp." /LENGTH=97 /DNA_ID=CAMNT_0042462527 /DNA_START=80 /DNA_END=373 /DNA_ORIENTATION=-